MRPLQVVSPIHKAQRQLHFALTEKCLAVGIPGNEGHVLSFLVPYGPCKVGDLVRVFGYRPSTMSGVLDRLEDAGLLRRKTDPSDRRSFLVEATRRGARLGDEARRIVHDFEEEILDRVSDDDLDGFHAVLEALAQVAGVAIHPREVQKQTSKAKPQRGTKK